MENIKGKINSLSTYHTDAYAIAVANGFNGTVEEWLESHNGKSAYELAVMDGFKGTEQEWLASLHAGKVVSTTLIGQDASGGNIYRQTYLDGTTATFTAPKGEKGEQGEQGPNGGPPPLYHHTVVNLLTYQVKGDSGNVTLSFICNSNTPFTTDKELFDALGDNFYLPCKGYGEITGGGYAHFIGMRGTTTSEGEQKLYFITEDLAEEETFTYLNSALSGYFWYDFYNITNLHTGEKIR